MIGKYIFFVYCTSLMQVMYPVAMRHTDIIAYFHIDILVIETVTLQSQITEATKDYIHTYGTAQRQLDSHG